MNEIERRTLIGAAGIGALAALSKAGPLNPPAGPVAPTGRTLEEVYDKIPPAPTPPPIGGYDGRTPVSGPAVIAAPGSYVLTANITGAGPLLTINADDVTLDLNGFTLTNSNITSTTLALASDAVPRTGITVRNGSIVGGETGIASGQLARALLEDLNVSAVRISGISMTHPLNRTIRLYRCCINDTGAATLPTDNAPPLSGIHLVGSANHVDRCSVLRLTFNGTGNPSYRPIRVLTSGGAGVNVVSGCTVLNDTNLPSSAILMSGPGVYRDNTVANFNAHFDASSAVNGGGNV